MNIKEAKTQIQHAIQAYFTKNEFGDYVIPIERQRPIFLIGAPGIGKTAIMEQIAAELNVGLISYSMTHHTRQSAIGLPFISRKSYGGQEYDVSEYTMSEIISSVYDTMEESGVKEGILFLDEINCVSETLAPAMLQFLQYKIFGRHRVPDGWILVTAGNPPEYNNSVREFDIVTLDRLKKIEVVEDYPTWKEYAYKKGVHPAILTYLDIKKADFYRVETTVDGKSFVTARGWDDLSKMIELYEQHGIQVDESLVTQYVQSKKIAKEFAIYYDLFNKYKSDYQVDNILNGKIEGEVKARAKKAAFDERLSLLGLLLSAVTSQMRQSIEEELFISELLKVLKVVKEDLVKRAKNPTAVLEATIARVQREITTSSKAGSLSDEAKRVKQRILKAIEGYERIIKMEGVAEDANAAFKAIKAAFDKAVEEMKGNAEKAGKRLSNLFKFAEEVFDSGQEMLILVTELTTNYYSSKFISKYGSKEYFAHNKELLLYERHQQIITQIDLLELE
jgi:hypothetical protein